MDLFKLLERQLKNQNVGTLTLGRSKRFREIFFDREATYATGNEFAGKVAFEHLLETRSVWKRLDLPSLEAIILSTDLKHILLPQVLFDQGFIDERELQPLAEAQLQEEIIDLLSQNTGSFHYQEGRVPEYLLQHDAIHTRIPVKLQDIIDELQRRNERLAETRALVPSGREIFVLTERGMAYRQTSPEDFVLQRVLGMVDGFRDLDTVVADSYFFESTIIEHLAAALKKGYIKKTIHPELKGISTRGLSTEEATELLPHFKNAVKYGVDELAARERLAVIYEKVGMIDDAVIQYNFIGDTLFQMRKSAKAVRAYQRALTLKPGEFLLTDKITRIYLKTADEELAARNTEMAIQLLEGAVTLRPDDCATTEKLVTLLTNENKLKELIILGESMTLTARKSRVPDAAVCVLRGCLGLQKNNSSIRRRLINLYLDFEMTHEAATEMEVLAHSYLERSQFQKAVEVFEKIRLLPGIKYDTSRLQRAIKEQRPAEESRFNKGAALRFALLGVVVLLSVYQAWAFVCWSSIQRGHNLAYGFSPETLDEKKLINSLDESEKVSLVVLVDSREAGFRSLVSRYDRYIQEFPISFFAPAAISFRKWAQSAVDSLANTRFERKQALLTMAEDVLDRNGDFEEVKRILTRLLELPDGDPFLAPAEELRTKAMGSQAKRPSAAELYASATRLEKAGEYRRAFRDYNALLKLYPRSSLAAKVKIPILVDSVPRGAQLFEAETLLGSTPFPVRLDSGEATLIEARRPGFLPARGEWISADKFAKKHWSTLVILLAREPSDEDPVFEISKDRTASPAVFADDYIFWGDDAGQIHWGSLTSGEQDHLSVAHQQITIIGRPVVTPTAIYTRWSDGIMVRYLSRVGPPREWSLKEFNSGRIITTDLMTVSQLVLFGSRGKLKVVDGSGITSVYKPSYEFRPRVLAQNSVAGQILVGGDDGSVRAFVVGEKFSKLWGGRKKICDNEITQLVAAGDTVVVTDGVKIVFLDGQDGSPLGKPLAVGRRYCIHASAGRIFRMTTSRGFEVFDIQTRRALPVPSLLRDIVKQNKVFHLHALPGAVAVVLDGGPAAASGEERRVLICDARTLKPLTVLRSAALVRHLTGTKTHIAIVEAERISVFKR